MRTCEISVLFPREWKRALKKYARDLDTLLRLFEGAR